MRFLLAIVFAFQWLSVFASAASPTATAAAAASPATSSSASSSSSGLLSSGIWLHESSGRVSITRMRFAASRLSSSSSSSVSVSGVDVNDGLATLSSRAHYATLPVTSSWSSSAQYCEEMGYSLCTFKDVCPQGEGAEPIGANELPNQKVFVPILGTSSQPTNMYVAATATAGDGVCTRLSNPEFGKHNKKTEAGTTKALVPCCSTKKLQEKGFPSGVLKTVRVSNSMASRLRSSTSSDRRRARRRRARELALKKAEAERLRVEAVKRRQGKSCKEIKERHAASKDGVYQLDLHSNGKFVDVYCDMSTDGGGWTLISYSFRQQTVSPHSSEVSFLPNKDQGDWDSAKRDNVAALDANSLFRQSQQVILSVSEGGSSVVTGNAAAYHSVYKWHKPHSYHDFSFHGQTGCAAVQINNLKNGHSFQAYTFADRPQVSCAGHAGGTQHERQLIGFNSQGCHGVCGSDPVNSNGMLVWKGSGYTPTTSNGHSNPLRAAAMAFWVR